MPLPVGTRYEALPLASQKWGRAADLYLEVNLNDGEVPRWAATGFKTVPQGCPTLRASVEDPCSTASYTYTVGESFEAEADFTPFRIDETVQCSAIGVWSPEELQEWAQREARTVYSVALARQAMFGSYGAAGDAMVTVADEVTIVADLSPVSALAAVELGLGQRLMGQGMVHMAVDSLTRLKSAGALNFVDGVYYTPSGHIVVADYGYYNTGTNYIYGTGPVFYQTTDWKVNTGVSIGAGGHNDMTVYVSAYAIVFFEPCPVVRAATNAAAPSNFGGV